PNLARLREVDDVLEVVAGPGNVLLPGLERHADGVHAGNDAMDPLVDLGEDGRADARHDAHVDDDIGGVGQFDADLRHGRAERPHGKREDVHGAALLAAGEELLDPLAHDIGVFPVVGGAGVVLGERADECALLDARDVGGRGAGVKAAWPLLIVEREEGDGLYELVAEEVVLLLSAGDPVDALGLGEFGHLFDPANEMSVGGRGSGGGLGRHRSEFIFLWGSLQVLAFGAWLSTGFNKYGQMQRQKQGKRQRLSTDQYRDKAPNEEKDGRLRARGGRCW